MELAPLMSELAGVATLIVSMLDLRARGSRVTMVIAVINGGLWASPQRHLPQPPHRHCNGMTPIREARIPQSYTQLPRHVAVPMPVFPVHTSPFT